MLPCTALRYFWYFVKLRQLAMENFFLSAMRVGERRSKSRANKNFKLFFRLLLRVVSDPAVVRGCQASPVQA